MRHTEQRGHDLQFLEPGLVQEKAQGRILLQQHTLAELQFQNHWQTVVYILYMFRQLHSICPSRLKPHKLKAGRSLGISCSAQPILPVLYFFWGGWNFGRGRVPPCNKAKDMSSNQFRRALLYIYYTIITG